MTSPAVELVTCRLCDGRGRVWREHRRTPEERRARAVEMRVTPEQTAPFVPVSLICSLCEGDGFEAGVRL